MGPTTTNLNRKHTSVFNTQKCKNVSLQYDEVSLTFTAWSVSLCCVCSHVVIFGMSVRLLWYPMGIHALLDVTVMVIIIRAIN